MGQRNSAAANTRLRNTDWHAPWSSSYACAWCTPFYKGTLPLVRTLRGHILLVGVHFSAFLAPVTVLSDAQIMHTATMGRTQKQDGEGGIDQEDIFHRVVFFLAALTRRLFRSILGRSGARRVGRE